MSVDTPRGTSWFAWGAMIVVPLALALAAYVLIAHRPAPATGTGSAADSLAAIRQQFRADPQWVGYERVAAISLDFPGARTLLVDGQGQWWVAGKNRIGRLDPQGATREQWPVDGDVRCLAAVPEGHALDAPLIAGLDQQVLLLSPQGQVRRRWRTGSDRSRITCVALTNDRLYVADAGQRLVLQFDLEGTLLGKIGAHDPQRQMPGFVIPSSHFDLVADDDGLLVVNPGARRVERYSDDGQLQSFWGTAGNDLPAFFGCCNPAHLIALGPDRLVTSEKGIPRIKVYDKSGQLQAVVADPQQLGVTAVALGDARVDASERVFPVAVDQNQDLLVLDPRRQRILRFRPKKNWQSPAAT